MRTMTLRILSARVKLLARKIPVVGAAASRAYAVLRGRVEATQLSSGSSAYWEGRYASGGNSGAGSYGKFAELKAEVINGLVSEYHIRSVIEFGCGDGHQLTLAKYPEYLGFDVSPTAVSQCLSRFEGDLTKSFRLLSDYGGEQADLALSLDVIYHLVEDEVFLAYMERLFASARALVVIYSSNQDDGSGRDGAHIRHRQFSRWVAERAPDWVLTRQLANRYPYCGDATGGSFADFYVYARKVGAKH